MIVQHPMLWCAVALMAGIALGLNFPLPFCLPALATLLIACTLLRKSHWHDALTVVVWVMIGWSKAPLTIEHSPLTIEHSSVREVLAARLERAGVATRTRGLAAALTLGKRDGLDFETKQAYRKVGASHLLALSGMHLGIVYGFLFLFFIRPIRFSKWRWHALPLILLCLWGYALVAGLPVSLVRAALMLSVFTIVSLMQYDTDPLHPLALSAIIILLIAPEELLSVSFQLSFAAVFFLLTLWEPICAMFPKIAWPIRLFAVSCVASLGTMPLSCYYFHQMPLIGPLLSVVLIPLTTLIIYLAIAAMAVPVAPLGWLLNNAEALQQRIIELAGCIPGATLTDLYPSKTLIALIYGAMVVAIVRLRGVTMGS